MTLPTLTVLIDVDADGSFEGAEEYVPKRVSWTRGRNADFSGDAQGSATVVLNDLDGTVGDGIPLGSPILVKTTSAAHFYGYVQRKAQNAKAREVTITAYDPLRRMGETDVVVAANSFVQRSARDIRLEILADYQRGTRNLLANPEFAAATTGWSVLGTGTLTRRTDDGPLSLSTCGNLALGGSVAAGQGVSQYARLAPVFFAGQVYRFSVYLRVVSGTLDVELGLGGDLSSANARRTVSLTTAWQRFTVTYTVPTTATASGAACLQAFVRTVATAGPFDLRVGAAAVTRGQGLFPYAAAGTGRWPSWCGNGSFDGAALNGWYDGWHNLVANPSFETNTTGWSVAADSFHTASASIARSTAQHLYGAASGLVDVDSTGDGAHYALSGTFLTGVTYDVMISLYGAGSGWTLRAGIGSDGTPADVAQTGYVNVVGGWTALAVSWTPTSDRTDAHLWIQTNPSAGDDFYIDGAMVTRRDSVATSAPAKYADTGPGGGTGSFVTTRTISTSVVKYGARSHGLTTPATAGAGRIYNLGHLGGYFIAGQAYTASVWLRATSAMPYLVALGANDGAGAYDEATATGTLVSNTWTQITLTWTPTADRPSSGFFDVCLSVFQTNGTGRTFYVDGVRIIPGSSADAFEPAGIEMTATAEDDAYTTTAALATSAAAALGILNRLTLSRHWARPELTTPYWTYVVEAREDLATKSVADTFDDDFSGFENAEADRDSVINIVPVNFLGGTEYYADEDSVLAYGPQPGAAIAGTSFFPDRTIGDEIGPLVLARYSVPRGRPSMTLRNDLTRQLALDVGDLLTVSLTRLGIVTRDYLILTLTTSVTNAGKFWSSVYQLEEAP